MSKNYIVQFKENTPEDVVAKIKSDVAAAGGSIKHEYTLIPGFSCSLPDDHVSVLSAHPNIANVEPDQEVSISA
ncbi:uncharacterized protein SAPINGB_P004751 [Magnusiomyces paraingens]|uniref:Inhibitor I9 domain-containing protein n=1 Tax=Magnusiomyces paraingens TaxID=2606893 RepID=A0A5E8BWH8_9ASCO|nr:uncharacterized protein SAPINGB_P004751 [Saprochaete ingens]VVT55813.1 unnamed protein product [Saprochaete ingens]